MDNTDSRIKSYLSNLNNTVLLTREEERKLLESIETRQNRILNDCVSSEFFKAELLDLLKSQDVSEIVNISRKLDDEESTEEEIKAMTKEFEKLISALENSKDLATVQKLLVSVSLSGTLIHTLITQIKKKCANIVSYEKNLANFLKFFEVKSETELQDLIVRLKSDEATRAAYVRDFFTTEQRLMSRVYEYTELMDSLQDLEKVGVNRDNFEEIKSLFKSITATEAEMKKFRDELVTRNLRLVVSCAKAFMNRGLDFDDLVQEGNIGLIKAVDKHDASRKTKIATYATWWINQSIRRAISNKAKTVRIPTHIEFLQTQLASVVSKLTNELGRPPSKEEIVASKRIDVDVETLEKLESIALHKMGIDDEMSTGVSMMDILPSDPSESPFNLASKKLLRERIRAILSTLPPRTEKIIRLRFGIGEPQDEMTLQEIASQVGLTKMGVRLVQNKGLEKIKKKGEFKDDLSE